MEDDLTLYEQNEEQPMHFVPYIFPIKYKIAVKALDETLPCFIDNSIEEETTSVSKLVSTGQYTDISQDPKIIKSYNKSKEDHSCINYLESVPKICSLAVSDNIKVIYLLIKLKYNMKNLSLKLSHYKKIIKAFDVENNKLNEKKNLLTNKLHLKFENLRRQKSFCGWCI